MLFRFIFFLHLALKENGFDDSFAGNEQDWGKISPGRYSGKHILLNQYLDLGYFYPVRDIVGAVHENEVVFISPSYINIFGNNSFLPLYSSVMLKGIAWPTWSSCAFQHHLLETLRYFHIYNVCIQKRSLKMQQIPSI